ncbi:PAS domain S-box-containing protein/diguanylate cyclase (GGDEF) domain-containing protein [Caenispirillum bisanense]|uniref:PAS domain S-box-containing protein/diguanylate cyclase (GGDEF) domain-containing protein n=2 Tax=Caenispirillum bisanense TaxID=414052 RepID=A0A286GPI6_9PROT|nr:PAS domain S-box-containing protein/diguanylate cyclase (GGDEF) domain-containing protein [Caenispirillum bisanense]
MVGGMDTGDGVLDALDCGVALLDDACRIVFWNTWLARRSGISGEDAHGRTLTDLFGDAAAPALVEAVQQAAGQGMASVLSNQLHRSVLPLTRSSDGEPLEQSAAVRPVRGSRRGVLLQINDVSAVVRRERHLRQTQAAVHLRNRAIEASSQGILIVDAAQPDMPIIYTNPAFTEITGFTPDEVMGQNCRFLQAGDSDQPGLAEIRAAIAERREGMAVIRNFRKDGTAFWNELMVAPVFDTRGQLTHYVGIQRDITLRRDAEEARDAAFAEARAANERLQREQAFTNAVLRTVGALVAVVDRRGRIVSFNRACEKVTGLAEADAVGTGLGDLIPDAAVASRFRLDQQGGLAEGSSVTTGLRAANGTTRIVRWTVTTLRDREGVATHLICTGIDVTERDRATALLRAEREILEMVARADPLAAVGDRICRAIEEQMPGRRAAMLRLVGDALHHLAAPSLPADYVTAADGVVIGGNVGSCGPAAFTGHPVFSADVQTDANWIDFRDAAVAAGFSACWSMPVLSQAEGVLGTFAIYGAEPGLPDDASVEVMQRAARLAAIAIERHQSAERIRHLALYDQLTGLANRSLLSDRLQAALVYSRRHKTAVALLFIDLDGFKPINDRYGHDAGDAVLATVGRRLKAVLREVDTAARIGGDEFVVLAEEVATRADAERIADKILAAVRDPVSWEGEDLAVGASIGLAFHPDDSNTGDGLLTIADNAMYAAKAGGKNRWSWRLPGG